MDFSKRFEGTILHREDNELTDRATGELIQWTDLEILAEVDGEKRAVLCSAGKRVLDGQDVKPGSKVKGYLGPGRKPGKAKLLRLL